MLTNIYRQIRQLLPQLTHEERKQLVEEIEQMIKDNVSEPLHNIMEFVGFAEETWKNVDVDVYLKELRCSQK